jgi:DNA-binding MurR/RpiR family transcriptional regulator
MAEASTEALVISPTPDGLADFKLKLAGSVNEGVPFVHRAVDDDDKAGDIVVKVVDNTVAAMLRYRNAAASQSVERAIAVLAETGRQGRRVEFYGVGNSAFVAQDAQHKFFRLGITAAAISDGHVQVMSATMLREGDCAVVISNSGRSRDLLDVTEIAPNAVVDVTFEWQTSDPVVPIMAVATEVLHVPCVGFAGDLAHRLLHLGQSGQEWIARRLGLQHR